MWGRTSEATAISKIGAIFSLLIAPFLVAFLNGSYLFDFEIFTTVLMALGMFIMFQSILMSLPDYFGLFVPLYVGGVQKGSLTPAGHTVKYNINGLQAYFITHLVVFAFHFEGTVSLSILAENWKYLFWPFNVAGYLVALGAYIKAKTNPTHTNDRKFTNCWYYDFCMGVEFNPEIFGIDLKLLFNGRIGMMLWSIVNLSYIVHQYESYGTVSNSLILVGLLQELYILDFYFNEKWYIKTIDICHDHFGYYFTWGAHMWVPMMYTLQASYLGSHAPLTLDTEYFCLVLTIGVAGDVLFRWTNHQKDRFRSDPDAEIFGKAANYLECEYMADGVKHKTKLLLSGFWGISRHMNYTGDLILSLCYSLATGFESPIPYFYFLFMLILLTFRCLRDEHRCGAKYGAKWVEYCQKVKCRYIPYVF
eukprot:TRINITY_DN5083_c0_g1_i1.p1 TRINITY_DN5083_c0_g1~~TRINITY_DN5083_c0_g1_i1.p1  ORF type:complete len:420 (+),score=40.18 TRINITY_DN5083_c0_g1_i1:132-1391(+)